MARPGEVFMPLVRWLGGKSRAVGDILAHLPYEIDRYFEPFCGGAAVFWGLYSGMRIRTAVLGDINEDLMNFYKVVRDHVEPFIPEIEKLAAHVGDEEFYYELRDTDPELLTDIERAARFLFLNKTCFNGLYRVNAKGKFNVPYGKVQAVFNYAALQNASTVLRDVVLQSGIYQETCKDVRPGDVIYVDSPYWPLRKGGFVGYDRVPFGPDQQAELAVWCRETARNGAIVLASNHDVSEVRSLYVGSRFIQLQERRAVAAAPDSRNPVGSLLIVVGGDLHGQVSLPI